MDVVSDDWLDRIRAEYPIGTKVRFRPVIRRPEFEDAEVRSEPWLVAGHPVVAITGRSGGVAVSHLEKRAPAPPAGEGEAR